MSVASEPRRVACWSFSCAGKCIVVCVLHPSPRTCPFRPSTNSTACPDGRWYDGATCRNGFNFVLEFDLTDQGVLSLPLNVVPAVAFNTQTYGDAPIGIDGPYTSLNVAMPTLSEMAAPPVQIGTTGALMWDSTYLGRTRGVKEDTTENPGRFLIMRIQ
jgi:hypothetical protein